MEVSPPTAADYASNAADHARASAEAAHKENRLLRERVEVLENKVTGLFAVLNYILDPQVKNVIFVDDETGAIKLDKPNDDICNPSSTGCGGMCSGCE